MPPPEHADRKIIEIERDFQDNKQWAEETLHIRDKSGTRIPYKFAPGPAKLWAAAKLQRDRGLPIRIIMLKARQVYGSTWIAAFFVQMVAFLTGQKALIVSHNVKSAENIGTYYEQFIDEYQPFRGVVQMLPHTTVGETISFEGGGSIDVATASNVNTGRSFTFQFLHLSEYAFYAHAKKLARALFQSVPSHPDTAIFIESTANGVGGDFYERCQEAMDPTSDSAWIFVFLGYWEHPEYTRRVENPAAFQASLTKEEVEEREKYRLTLGQLNWRRWCIKNNCGGSIDTFRQEFPGNPQEAFLLSGRSRFSHQSLSRMPVLEAPLVGELQSWTNGPKRVVQFMPTEKGALAIYKKPQLGRRYIMGCDIAEGHDAGGGELDAQDHDYTVLTVVEQDTGEQVCKFRARIWPGTAADTAVLLLEWYNWAYVVPERNGPGIAFIDGLLRNQYPIGLIFHGQASPDETTTDAAEYTRLGWQTNSVSKVHLVSALDTAIREMSIIMRDAHTVQECRTFVIHSNGKCAAMKNCHDDEVIAIALAVIGLGFAPKDSAVKTIRENQNVSKLADPVQSYGRNRYGKRDEARDKRGTIFRF